MAMGSAAAKVRRMRKEIDEMRQAVHGPTGSHVGRRPEQTQVPWKAQLYDGAPSAANLRVSVDGTRQTLVDHVQTLLFQAERGMATGEMAAPLIVIAPSVPFGPVPGPLEDVEETETEEGEA